MDFLLFQLIAGTLFHLSLRIRIDEVIAFECDCNGFERSISFYFRSRMSLN